MLGDAVVAQKFRPRTAKEVAFTLPVSSGRTALSGAYSYPDVRWRIRLSKLRGRRVHAYCKQLGVIAQDVR
ncbi:hypothetical protein KCP70_10590 [Salmonella enterica subsp. enterica]|nr:hypothetical protein KCP70_10590 [Salmonella enterica subsp. enterica]